MEQFQLKPTIFFGSDALAALEGLAGRRVMVITDSFLAQSGLLERVRARLRDCTVEVFDQVVPDPPLELVAQGARALAEFRPQAVVAFGGGSPMDCAKAMLEFGKKLGAGADIRFVAVPTTAGTGSEATPNSIVAVPEEQLKVGIVNPEMIADAVILDGNMIRRLPRKIAASTGIDALCHAIECYTSAKANPFSDLFAMQALRLIFRNLEKACDDPDALDAKEKMMQAAFYAGVAITCSGTTAVHALSYPLGGRYHIPHGVANAIMLMPVMQFNKSCCIERFAEVYEAVGGTGARNSAEKADWVIAKMDAMVQHLDIPTSLKPYGVTEADLPALVKAGMDVQRLLVNNPRTVTAADAEALYRAIL